MMTDAINPGHYKRLPAEAIEIIEAMIAGAPDNKAAYLHGQAAKYDLRLWEKGKSLEDFLSDWGKHIWYALRLESHLLGLIEKQKADEQQEAADLQSLKDHPFGKLKDPAIKQALTTAPPDGWRPKDNVALAMQMAANLFGGKDGVFNACNFSNAIRQLAGVGCTLDGHVVATILGGRSDVEVLKGKSHYRYLFYESINSLQEPVEPPKPTVEVTGEATVEVKPPDGWRWLERGELIRNGDKQVKGGAVPLLWIGTPCCGEEFILRRNRFEVGEKVMHGDCKSLSISVVESILGDGWVDLVRDGVSTAYHVKDLAPYIEETT